METKIPFYHKMAFSYLIPSEIKLFDEILGSSVETIHAAFSNYSILGLNRSDGGYPNTDDTAYCIIPEILYNQITLQLDPNPVQLTYNELVVKHGQAKVDMVIPMNSLDIKRKILKIINFVMNDLYHCDYLKVEFDRYKEISIADDHGRPSPVIGTSMVLQIIYEVIQENFIITEQNLDGKRNSIYFMRKGDN